MIIQPSKYQLAIEVSRYKFKSTRLTVTQMTDNCHENEARAMKIGYSLNTRIRCKKWWQKQMPFEMIPLILVI